MYGSIAVLPHGTANAAKNDFPTGLGDGTIHVIKTSQTKQPFRLMRSFGVVAPIGSSFEARHDQAMRRLGWFTVVGMVHTDTGRTEGEVPNRKIPLWHVK